jgi:hypothetical protein
MDEFICFVTNGEQSADQEFDFDLNFPKNSFGQGTTTSGTVQYLDYVTDVSAIGFIDYNFVSAVAVEVPEPGPLALLSTLSLALLGRRRRRRH